MFVRRRLAVGAVVVAATLTALLGLHGAVRSGATASGGPAVATSLAVVPGDTLWSVVGRLGIDGDRQAVVARLAEVNGGTVIRPGQRLTIPADVAAMRS